MSLKIFSTVGAALHFGVSRLETAARVAWLPITLILVFDMALVFGVFSLVNDRFLTFSDLSPGASFEQVSANAQQVIRSEVGKGNLQIIALSAAFLGLNLILVASFMAPLIKFAGLGERPGPGVVRLPFGADQLRYIFAQAVSVGVALLIAILPALTAIQFIARTVDTALKRSYASFPDSDSLHTIELVPAAEALALRGQFWIFDFGLVSALAGVAFVIFFVVLMRHFHPRNRPNAGEANPLARSIVIALILGTLLSTYSFFVSATVSEGQVTPRLFAVNAYLGAFYLFVAYLSLRFAAYPGIAVCKESLGFSGVFNVSRGWNIFRLAGIFLLLMIVLVVVQGLIDGLILPLIGSTVGTLFTASEAASRLVNQGEGASWILPTFVWLWWGVKIVYKFFWLFFTYGVWAGLFGQFYKAAQVEAAD